MPNEDLNLAKVAKAWAESLGFVQGGYYPNPDVPGEHVKATGFLIGLDYDGRDYHLLIDGRTPDNKLRLVEATKILEHTGSINASFTLLNSPRQEPRR